MNKLVDNKNTEAADDIVKTTLSADVALIVKHNRLTLIDKGVYLTNKIQ
ncbi:hypothetical protein J4447_01130 [Candidatus Pacearchaeota archaeon]|nr:hypothetical protein [Candidatus Pacearchaeota archaeon]